MKLAGFGLSVAQLVAAIETNNSTRGANYIERFGESYVVRATGRVEKLTEIGDIVVAAHRDIPIRVREVADITIGRDLRTGSGSIDGRETVLGTALMLVGGNSRTVAAAADAKLAEVNRTLPPGIRARPVLNRTELVDATVHTVVINLMVGAALVILVLLLLLGNFRAAVITALVIPVTMLITAVGMLELKISANLMSLGALDFGLIVDGGVIIAENSLRRLAERQRALGRVCAATSASTRSRRHRARSSSRRSTGMHIALVYVPLLTFSGIEGKTFQPMALTVIVALATAFVLSLTFMPAMIAIFVTGRVDEHENAFVRGLKTLYRPALAFAIRRPLVPIAAGGRPVRWRRAAVHAPRPGIHPAARREEHRHGGKANPEHIAVAIAGDAVHQREHAAALSAGGFRFFARRHAGPCGGPHAAERDRHLRHPETA